jgi:hypothetical protein
MRLEPQNVLIDALLDQVESGQVRVPRFQRPFVWSPDRMLELFDSIEKSYPIGSLLLWQTGEAVPSLDAIGDIAVPPPPVDEPASYVLDGHQRLSTLFGVLRQRRDAPRTSEQRHWRWWVYRALGERGLDKYLHVRRQGEVPARLLPLRMVSRTMDFLEFSRDLEIREKDRVADLIREAESVTHKIKNYQITLIRLIGGSIDQAVDVYTRLNRTGVRMEPDQMVSALTYRVPDQPTLADQVDQIIGSVAETGFGTLPRMPVFRTVLAVSGEPDVMSPSWKAVSERLTQRLPTAVPDTERAVRAAVEFLRNDIGLALARFLPYAHQLMLLAVFFHSCREPTDQQRQDLVRWFWITSWTNRFAGASYALIRDSLGEMRVFAEGRGTLALDAGSAQPIPDSFNLNSARTLAYVTWELREFPRRMDAAGTDIDLVKLLASGDAHVFRQVVPGNSHPANRVVLPTPPGMSVRQALTEMWVSDPAAVLESHGIPMAAWHRLCEGDGRGFVRARAEHLEGRLRAFMDTLELTGRTDLVGGSDDDTEYGNGAAV